MLAFDRDDRLADFLGAPARLRRAERPPPRAAAGGAGDRHRAQPRRRLRRRCLPPRRSTGSPRWPRAPAEAGRPLAGPTVPGPAAGAPRRARAEARGDGRCDRHRPPRRGASDSGRRRLVLALAGVPEAARGAWPRLAEAVRFTARGAGLRPRLRRPRQPPPRRSPAPACGSSFRGPPGRPGPAWTRPPSEALLTGDPDRSGFYIRVPNFTYTNGAGDARARRCKPGIRPRRGQRHDRGRPRSGRPSA